jgi:hypothetical protein
MRPGERRGLARAEVRDRSPHRSAKRALTSIGLDQLAPNRQAHSATPRRAPATTPPRTPGPEACAGEGVCAGPAAACCAASTKGSVNGEGHREENGEHDHGYDQHQAEGERRERSTGAHGPLYPGPAHPGKYAGQPAEEQQREHDHQP